MDRLVDCSSCPYAKKKIYIDLDLLACDQFSQSTSCRRITFYIAEPHIIRGQLARTGCMSVEPYDFKFTNLFIS